MMEKAVQNNKVVAEGTRRYDTYKDSDVEWLGEIPAHWDLTRLGTRFKERKTKVSDKDFPPLSVTKNGTVPQLSNAAKSNDGDNRKLVKKGDFAINSRSDRKGSSGIAYQDGSVSLIYIVMEPLEIHPIYCNYLLKSYNFIEEFYRMGHGIVADLWTTRYDEMKAIMVGIPPLSEQTKIAHFLDDKTAKIDEAIAIKEQQINLLKERKQILIHKAVTQGLNPNVKLKDSGVEWIGEIPEGWEVKRLKFLFEKIQTGTTPSTSNQNFYDGDIDWYNPGDLNNEVLFEAKRKLSKLSIQKREIKFFPKDSILVVGIGATSGKTSYLVNKGTFNQQITGFHSNTEHNNFFFYLLKSLSVVMLNTANYTTLAILNNEFFKALNLIKPPFSEQKEISAYIETASQKIETAIRLKKQEIEKLKEYKSSLINSVVTGKVKVC